MEFNRSVWRIIHNPPEPYDGYRKATVIIHSDKVKWVHFELPHPGAELIPDNAVLYADYVATIEYFKKYRRNPSKDVRLIFRNGDVKDDRVENLRYASSVDAVLEADATRYSEQGPPDKKVVAKTRALLSRGVSWTYVEDHLGITHAYLRYLIHTKLPDLTGTAMMRMQIPHIQEKWGNLYSKDVVEKISVYYGIPAETLVSWFKNAV